jgi:hypothetical protein
MNSVMQGYNMRACYGVRGGISKKYKRLIFFRQNGKNSKPSKIFFSVVLFSVLPLLAAWHVEVGLSYPWPFFFLN